MARKEQKYATKKFNCIKSAESFKKRVGSNFNITEHFNERGKQYPKVYHIRFKIDKSRPKKDDFINDDFERYWKD